MPSTDLQRNYPVVLRELAQIVSRMLEATGIEAPRAGAIGETVSDEVAALFGGQVVYFPVDAQRRAHQRWQLIWEKFNGHNHAELAREFGMGMHHVYRVIAIMRAEHRKASQRTLFEAPKPEGEA